MPVLENPRWEHFATLVAGGAHPTKAYVLAGYRDAGAKQSALRLRRNANISARIAHLQKKVEEKTIDSSAISRHWVIRKLQYATELALRLEDDDKTPGPTFNLAAANQSLRMLGLEVGMFRENVDHTMAWSGDLSKLDERQLAALITSLEQIQAAEQAQLPGPVTIEATAEPAP